METTAGEVIRLKLYFMEGAKRRTFYDFAIGWMSNHMPAEDAWTMIREFDREMDRRRSQAPRPAVFPDECGNVGPA